MDDTDFAPLLLRWRTAPDVSLAPSGDTAVALMPPRGDAVILSPGSAGLRDALLALAAGADEARLLALAGDDGVALLYYCLAELVGRGVLEASADRDGAPAVRLVPRSTDFELPLPPPVPQRVALDRFVCLRRTGRGATLQLPDASCDVVIEDASCGGLIARLAAGPLDTARLTDPGDRALARLLVALGFAVDADAAESPSRQTWEFHDRLFQRAARSYPDFVLRGATYRFVGSLPAPPAIRPAYAGVRIALPDPTPDAPSNSSVLRDVMESRRSRRAMAEQPVGLDEIGQLLHRVARITAVLPGGPQVPQDLLMRPYPSGGAIHELEYYLAIRTCAGLAPGFYHYRGQEHVLTRIADAEAPAASMLADCAATWGQPDRPQVLMVIASRLPRLAWKYSGIAYKLSLMNAGVALQSLYLVATDLGLAGAAAGSGNPEHFARATGVSSWEETSIAEFGFGRPA
jgi:oxazoline/thiazoline dehydrogenase